MIRQFKLSVGTEINREKKPERTDGMFSARLSVHRFVKKVELKKK